MINVDQQQRSRLLVFNQGASYLFALDSELVAEISSLKISNLTHSKPNERTNQSP